MPDRRSGAGGRHPARCARASPDGDGGRWIVGVPGRWWSSWRLGPVDDLGRRDARATIARTAPVAQRSCRPGVAQGHRPASTRTRSSPSSTAPEDLLSTIERAVADPEQGRSPALPGARPTGRPPTKTGRPSPTAARPVARAPGRAGDRPPLVDAATCRHARRSAPERANGWTFPHRGVAPGSLRVAPECARGPREAAGGALSGWRRPTERTTRTDTRTSANGHLQTDTRTSADVPGDIPRCTGGCVHAAAGPRRAHTRGGMVSYGADGGVARAARTRAPSARAALRTSIGMSLQYFLSVSGVRMSGPPIHRR